MLRLPPFEYVAATSLDSAVERLAAEPHAMVVSGGTDLYANMKQRLFTPPTLIGLRAIPDLRFILFNEVAGLTIGATTTITDIATSAVVRRHYPALANAAELVSTPQLRNMGTIGGNLCLDTRCNYYNQNLDWRKALGFCMKKDGDVCKVALSSPKCVAVNSSDTAPVLQAFGARVRLRGPQGEREIPIADFYRNDGMFAWNKAPGEILSRVLVPPPPAGTRSAYRKLRLRNSFDFPIVSVAAVVVRNEAGVCTDARVVINAVASQPLEIPLAAQALIGSALDASALQAAAEAAFALGKPLDNTSGSIPYRKRMIRVFARRALEDCAAA
ncbi:MAG: 4-hydroxybenzoyl-CoA reductase [Candidatus Eremiobacter antarcticus]|nr:FAD binding domain-containing protein [Candidatus Eremiobacteraeota bacterium]MBC5807336.1 FAD binding domain-containing protein [Candidatus Eremiobacteraeota bacterium]PZR63091.1 MAG: 4-hydroxybenzoyl-CoA reductase [Candidatus Eremiobacter sp. RRmetagenome_bin22]